jgi:cytochrome P450
MVLDDVELGGVHIPKGAVVLLVWGSGNRDPERFDDPERFSIDRDQLAKNQLAFGRGIHMCLGAPLARLEGRVAIDRLLSRFDTIRYTPGKNTFAVIDSVIMRTLEELHLDVA